MGRLYQGGAIARASLVLLLLGGCEVCAMAQDAPLSWGKSVPVQPSVADEVHGLIERQLDAFRRHDAEGAYAETAPNVRRRFPTPGAFMAMAQGSYGPLLRSARARYTSIRGAAATPTLAETWSQTTTIVTQDGETWTATYGVERQRDGSLKITNCVIVRALSGGA